MILQHLLQIGYLLFKQHIPVKQALINSFQVKIRSNPTGNLVYLTGNDISRCKKDTLLVVVKAKQQNKTDYLQKNKDEPVIVLYKKVE